VFLPFILFVCVTLPSVFSPVCLPTICLSVCLSVCPSSRLPVSPSVCLVPLCLLLPRSVCLSFVCLPVPFANTTYFCSCFLFLLFRLFCLFFLLSFCLRQNNNNAIGTEFIIVACMAQSWY
jgi:hypothetical protein